MNTELGSIKNQIEELEPNQTLRINGLDDSTIQTLNSMIGRELDSNTREYDVKRRSNGNGKYDLFIHCNSLAEPIKLGEEQTIELEEEGVVFRFLIEESDPDNPQMEQIESTDQPDEYLQTASYELFPEVMKEQFESTFHERWDVDLNDERDVFDNLYVVHVHVIEPGIFDLPDSITFYIPKVNESKINHTLYGYYGEFPPLESSLIVSTCYYNRLSWLFCEQGNIEESRFFGKKFECVQFITTSINPDTYRILD